MQAAIIKDLAVKAYAPAATGILPIGYSKRQQIFTKLKIGLDASQEKVTMQKHDPKFEPEKDEGGMSDVHIGAQEVVGEYLTMPTAI